MGLLRPCGEKCACGKTAKHYLRLSPDEGGGLKPVCQGCYEENERLLKVIMDRVLSRKTAS